MRSALAWMDAGWTPFAAPIRGVMLEERLVREMLRVGLLVFRALGGWAALGWRRFESTPWIGYFCQAMKNPTDGLPDGPTLWRRRNPLTSRHIAPSGNDFWGPLICIIQERSSSRSSTRMLPIVGHHRPEGWPPHPSGRSIATQSSASELSGCSCLLAVVCLRPERLQDPTGLFLRNGSQHVGSTRCMVVREIVAAGRPQLLRLFRNTQ